jgi:hypothetical protein
VYYTRFKVQGRGAFPFDMLRYDQCFPVSSDDAFLMSGDHSAEVRTIELGRYTKEKQNGAPTAARWASFVWSVDRDSVVSQRSHQ